MTTTDYTAQVLRCDVPGIKTSIISFNVWQTLPQTEPGLWGEGRGKYFTLQYSAFRKASSLTNTITNNGLANLSATICCLLQLVVKCLLWIDMAN